MIMKAPFHSDVEDNFVTSQNSTCHKIDASIKFIIGEFFEGDTEIPSIGDKAVQLLFNAHQESNKEDQCTSRFINS